MNCPYCGYPDQKVLESRDAREGEAIRRRRECLSCERRFTTFETFERPRLFVVKRDGTRQEFSRDKLLNSMVLACGKRPVSVEGLQNTLAQIERDLFQEWEEEVPSTEIGDRVMEALKQIDSVAFVRYASVYQEFDCAEDFLRVFKKRRSVSTKA